MRRLVGFASALLVIGALSMPIPAVAGGGNFLEFDEEYNAIDSEATVRGTVYAGKAETRAHAPFYVYLERLEFTGQRWDLPKVGEPGVYRVAKAKIVWDRTPKVLPGGSVSATFDVPDLRTGRYLVSICDRNCTHGLGGIDVSGYFHVVGTPGEARARTKAAVIGERFRSFRDADRRRDARTWRRHRADLDAAQNGEDLARTDLVAARDTIWGLRSDVNAARARIDDVAAQRNVAVVGLLLAIGIAAALAMRRRRTDLQLEAFVQDVRERGARDLFEFVGGPDRELLDIADLPEVDRSSDKDHVGVR